MNNNYPSVSIIIPLYKVEKYIEDCLRSVVEQDYQGEMECIIVDDCSPDNSLKIAKEFVENHNNRGIKFVFYQQDRNRKQSAARNKGLELAKNDCIFFIDADDWLDTSALSKMASQMMKHPQCQMVQAGTTRNNPESSPWFYWLESKSWDSDIEYTEDRQWIIDTCAIRKKMIPMTPYSKLIRRDFLLDNDIRFIEGFYHEDEVWLTLLSKYLQRVAFVHEDVYYYRIHTDSTTGGSPDCRYDDMRKAWIEILKLLDKDFCPGSVIKQIDFFTSRKYKENKTLKIKLMMLEMKFRLMPYYDLRGKLRMVKWIVTHVWMDLTHQEYEY